MVKHIVASIFMVSSVTFRRNPFEIMILSLMRSNCENLSFKIQAFIFINDCHLPIYSLQDLLHSCTGLFPYISYQNLGNDIKN